MYIIQLYPIPSCFILFAMDASLIKQSVIIFPGASIPPETMMHFPLFQISPPISEKFSDFLNFFYNFTFSRKISSLSSANISDDFFLVINHKFRISSYFRSFSTFPPVSRKLFFPPYFYNFPPVLGKFTCFLHTLRVFPP